MDAAGVALTIAEGSMNEPERLRAVSSYVQQRPDYGGDDEADGEDCG
jgi:hypothetical protein